MFLIAALQANHATAAAAAAAATAAAAAAAAAALQQFVILYSNSPTLKETFGSNFYCSSVSFDEILPWTKSTILFQLSYHINMCRHSDYKTR